MRWSYGLHLGWNTVVYGLDIGNTGGLVPYECNHILFQENQVQFGMATYISTVPPEGTFFTVTHNACFGDGFFFGVPLHFFFLLPSSNVVHTYIYFINQIKICFEKTQMHSPCDKHMQHVLMYGQSGHALCQIMTATQVHVNWTTCFEE